MITPERLRAAADGWRAGRWPSGDGHRFLLLAVLIGVFTGLLVTLFHIAIETASWTVLGTPVGDRRWATVLGPALGAGLAGLLVRELLHSARGSGISYTKHAIYVSDGRIPTRSIAAKFVACVLSVGSGAPLGPEDPALQMGAGIASLLGRTFQLSTARMRQIAPIGAAAGIAAAFNTPITAVLFVIEEVLSGWDAGVLGSILLAAVSASVVTRTMLGDAPLFSVPAFRLTDPSELLLYAAVGVGGGLVGGIATRGLLALRATVRRTGAWTGRVLPLAAGLAVGVVATQLPQVLGPGYGAIDAALHDEFTWPALIALGLAKAGLAALCFAAGVPGGLFAPALFVGAMLGGGIGGLAAGYWPAPMSPASAYVLVGMGTFFAAMFRTPMTSIFMVFEVSASYAIILPVMVANTLAFLVSRVVSHESLFEGLMRQDGDRFPSVEEGRTQAGLRVEDMMRPLDAATADLAGAREVHPDERADVALALLRTHPVLSVVSRGRPAARLGVVTRETALDALGLGPRSDAPPA